jgi:hypothetical protein
VLEGEFAEVAESQPEILARHCTEAGLIEKAASFWGKAGQQALARSATAEAMMQLRKGLALLAGLHGNVTQKHKELEFDLQVSSGVR